VTVTKGKLWRERAWFSLGYRQNILMKEVVKSVWSLWRRRTWMELIGAHIGIPGTTGEWPASCCSSFTPGGQPLRYPLKGG